MELLRCLTDSFWNCRLVNLIASLIPIENSGNSASFISNEGNIPLENCQNSTRNKFTNRIFKETSAEKFENIIMKGNAFNEITLRKTKRLKRSIRVFLQFLHILFNELRATKYEEENGIVCCKMVYEEEEYCISPTAIANSLHFTRVEFENKHSYLLKSLKTIENRFYDDIFHYWNKEKNESYRRLSPREWVVNLSDNFKWLGELLRAATLESILPDRVFLIKEERFFYPYEQWMIQSVKTLKGNIPLENCQNSTRETSAENVNNTPPFSGIFDNLTPISILTIIKQSMMAVTNMACRENLYVVEGESMAEFTAIQPREVFIVLSIFGARIRNLVKVKEAEEKSKVSDKWRDDVRYVQRQFGLIMDREGKISEDSKLSMQVKLLHYGAMECPEELLSTMFQEWRAGERVIEEIVISFQKPVDFPKRLAEAILGPGNFSQLWSVENHETSIYTTHLEQLKEQIALSDLDSIEIFIALSGDKTRSLIMTVASNAITIDTTGSDLPDIERLARRTFARFAKINSIYMVNTNRLRKLVAPMR